MTAKAAPEPQAFIDAVPPHTWLFYWETVHHQIAGAPQTQKFPAHSTGKEEKHVSKVGAKG